MGCWVANNRTGQHIKRLYFTCRQNRFRFIYNGLAVLGLGEKALSFYIASSQHNDVIILFGEQK